MRFHLDRNYLIFFTLSLALAGCEGTSTSFPLFREGVAVWGAKPLVKRDKFEKIDLPREILAATGTTYSDSIEIDHALRLFYASTENEDTLKLGRDRIQERILGASKQRCGVYRNFLKEFDAQSNLGLGALTTALAGAGAIFTGVDVVRALSGSASVVSGIRAELNETFFQTLTIQVITDGFNAKRENLYEQITERQRKPIRDYTLEAAIKDAVEFHEKCSLLAGLEHAALSIERARNPGLSELTKAANQIGVFRSELNTALDDNSIKTRSTGLTLPGSGDAIGDALETPSQSAKTPGNALAKYILTERTRDLLQAEIGKYPDGISDASVPKLSTISSRTLEAQQQQVEDATLNAEKICLKPPQRLPANPTALESKLHLQKVLLIQQCEKIVADQMLVVSALTIQNSQPTIVSEIQAGLDEATSIFSNEAKDETHKLEKDRILLLANDKTAEEGSDSVLARANLVQHEANIHQRIELLDALDKKLIRILNKSRKVLRTLKGLERRISSYNKDLKNLPVEADPN